ncbi:MAG: GGDEF domain-containing protein, partial [Clostridia bacterium]|nr:GGDEF domain-containing protein [Clostridia bacterium]
GLPGNKLIQEKLSALLERKEKFTFIYLDINDFKAYNDAYGFVKGDEAIKLLAKVIQSNISRMGLGNNDFVGHIGGDDFVIITIEPEDYATELCERITSEFNRLVYDLYNEVDRARGYVVARGHTPQEKKFPLMTLSTALLSPEMCKTETIWELAQIAAGVKRKAKLAAKSYD